ncbi:ADP-ribosylglycohydrolase family protein [Devosia ginsengisoli]|uniref:ADP-ribosylglycohydrolase family protein n=1 Tax=Devosia ginsengisoli TaxID=400770 RepID=UPI001FE359BC|nr:ADP-ribosylglycohydrolase family protein [Devosia ginsengisoli]
MLTEMQILEKIYAGFIGKAIGVRLGAPVEPTIWSYERIQKTYGEVTQYLRDFKNFAADDDTNGPVYFIRALRDYGLKATAADVGKTWLNYAAEEHGMYWWGGFGVSTEHTAYRNLRAGIPAPQSGSIAQNGTTVAEQIGGQIFIDSWGWVNPGNPQRAAEMSAMAASVAHDGDGLNGARFCAAAIAAAFEAKSIDEIVETALATVDAGSTYARVCRAVIDFFKANPDDWRACRDMLTADWGYDRYPGVCHIIPNAGVTVMAILYGKGDLPRTAEIATMAGWDTDCNAGNAAAIVATFQGLQEGWDKYRKPINDFLVASGIVGSINIVDIPSFARELTVLALQLAGARCPPCGWRISRGAGCGSTSICRARRMVSAPRGSTRFRCAIRASGMWTARAGRWKSSSTGWSAARAGGCSGSRSIGGRTLTTSAIGRCSRRWWMRDRPCRSSCGSIRGMATAICAWRPMCGGR